jgi:uncharacterized protein (DUF362 family)
MLTFATDRLFAQVAGAEKSADMSIARWTGAKQLDAKQFQNAAVKLTEKAIEALGGMNRFVSNGSTIWIKPNIAWDGTPESAANTNPDVVATLVRLCLAAGAKKVKVGDNPCDIAGKTYEKSGIAAAAKAAGAEVVFLDPTRFREAEIKGERLKTVSICPEIIECDLVINVPVAKHHRLSTATVCMKNYMGVIDKRPTLHQEMPTCLADLTRYMKPQLCVLDAMRILMAHGPKGGKLDDVQTTTTVAAGVDIVALDALGAELLGKKPTDIGTIVKGAEVGLGKIDYRSLALRELAIA